jgi:hypothetical protein
MPHRECTKTKTEVTRPNKRITLPVEAERYNEVVNDAQAYRTWLDEMIVAYPELFSASISAGYSLHDDRFSEKIEGMRLRRICLKTRNAEGRKQVFTIAPSSVMPYFVGRTDEVEKALFLRRFDVPFWALSYVFGRDDQYWYRLENQFGRYNLVQTVVKDPQKLPKHLLADEKITWLNGEEVVVATTVGDDCVLGASIALGIDTPNLEEAYQHFKDEALQLDPDYQPETVNTDGWEATQKAWRNLFPWIVLIECFLHAFIKIRERGKHLKDNFHLLSQKVWDVYHALDAATFRLQAAELLTWAENNTSGYVLEAVRKLYAKVERFALAYDHPLAHRTSNMLDRHMNLMDRWLYSSRFFHGHWTSAERSIRAWALLHDFGLYCPRTRTQQNFSSPAHKLNGFVYHENWLHNLLISTSLSNFNP